MKKGQLPEIFTLKYWLPLTGAVLTIGLLVVFFSRVPPEETTSGLIPSPREGFAAPDFTLETIDGNTLSLSELRGRAVVVNLWASWCPPCKAEMPALQVVYDIYVEQGLQVLAVNMTFQDSISDADEFIEMEGLDFPILLDRSGEVARLYQMRALPSTFFIDPEGVIQKVIIGGPMSESTIRTAIEEILVGSP